MKPVRRHHFYSQPADVMYFSEIKKKYPLPNIGRYICFFLIFIIIRKIYMYRTSDALVFTVLVLRTLKLIVKKKIIHN